MGRLSDLRVVDPVLTTLVRGYANAEFVGQYIFPFVTVQKEAGKIPTFGKESFKVFNTERAVSAKSNRIPREARSTVSFALAEHDAIYPVDYREVEEDVFNLRNYGAFRAQQAVMIKHESECATLATTAGNFPSGNKVTLSGTTQFTHAQSDPINVVKTGKEAVRAKIGKNPNVGVMGAKTFFALSDHAVILDRLKYSQLGVSTIDLMKALFGLDQLIVAGGMSSNEAGTLSDLWSDYFVLAYVAPTQGNVDRNIYEPSFGYTLRKAGMPEMDTFVEEGGKIENFRDTDIFQAKIVGSDAGYLISDTNA